MSDLVKALVGVILAVAVLPLGLHSVREGHVGVYWRGGALLSTVEQPGFHLKLPLVTSFAEVQVTVQTDAVSAIPCGTSGGVMVQFDRIEVVNRLREEYVYETVRNYTLNYDQTWIFDKVHHEINQFCSSHTLREVYIDLFDRLDESLATALQRDCDYWAPGIEIIAVRVTKPRVPDQIRRNFEQMEAEKTKLLIAEAASKVVEQEAETERKRANIQARKLADVSKINMEKEIAEKAALKKIATIEDEMHLHREKAMADAEFYRATKEAEANGELLTEQYLELQQILAMGNTTKVYFGPKLPGFYVDRSSTPAPRQLP